MLSVSVYSTPSSCLYPLFSQTICQVFLKFSIVIVYKKLLSKFELHENWLGDCHSLLKGTNEFLLLYSIFFD